MKLKCMNHNNTHNQICITTHRLQKKSSKLETSSIDIDMYEVEFNSPTDSEEIEFVEKRN